METTEKLSLIYRRLVAFFGPRHWWPAKTPFEVIVGAVLAQAVAWRNVVKVMENLKEQQLLTPQALYQVDFDTLATLLKPTRYYRMKTKKLKALIAFLVENYQGDLTRLFAVAPAQLRRQLLSVYGLGPETVDSILLYAGNLPVFVVDEYTRRIFFRLGLTGEKAKYQELQDFFTAQLPSDVPLFNDFHAQIVQLGNQVCQVKPKCAACPLGELCLFDDKARS